MHRTVKILFYGILTFFLVSCMKEDTFKQIPTSPNEDLTKGDCISCHTNANALLTNLSATNNPPPHKKGPIRKYSNLIQGDG